MSMEKHTSALLEQLADHADITIEISKIMPRSGIIIRARVVVADETANSDSAILLLKALMESGEDFVFVKSTKEQQ